ncbi:MAG TPA: cation:proton antiporter [Alphaproteobacteria bacterium]|nr:cation:proton antiporter [Alphaproteobacteria bacterium]
MPPLVLAIFGVSGLLALISLLPPLAPRLRLPLTVLFAALGCGLGFTLGIVEPYLPPGPLVDFFAALRTLPLSSEILLSLFLPALLFEMALSTDLRRLIDDLGPILLLAVIAVLITTMVVGWALAAATAMPILVCLLVGAIIATTDPAAIVGVFRDLGAPKRLTTLLEGESLFNDAAAIALFGLLAGLLSGQQGSSLAGTALAFIAEFAGGLGFGFIIARLGVAILRGLRGYLRSEMTLTVALAYLTFIAAEHYLHVSGVVAVVTAALVLGTAGRIRVPPANWTSLVEYWGQLGFWANAMIVLLSGLLVPRLISGIGWGEIFALAVLIAAALAARAIVLFGLWPVMSALKMAQNVTHPQKLVILWGGLRGAVSLALALAATEIAWIDPATRRFVGLLATGFVLFTLFVNGPSLRTLIRLLKLDRLTVAERAVREGALGLALGRVESRIGELADELGVPVEAVEIVARPYRDRLHALAAGEVTKLESEARLRLGLLSLVRREERLYLQYRRDRLVSSGMMPQLMADTGRLQDAVKVTGLEGYQAAARRAVGFSRPLRLALLAHRRLGIEGSLSRLIGQRFEHLAIVRLAIATLIDFARRRVAPVLGEDVAKQLGALLEERLAALLEALEALRLQYPRYARALEEQMLGRTALRLEQAEYDELLAEDVIGEEVHKDLNRNLSQRWRALDRPPPLDLVIPVPDQIARVPLFAELGPAARAKIARLLRARLAVPGERIVVKGERGDAMYFIASGAVEVKLDSTSLRLGSGDFFGELALLTNQPRSADVTALGYCRLLMLRARDFHRLLDSDSAFAEAVGSVARARLTVTPLPGQ